MHKDETAHSGSRSADFLGTLGIALMAAMLLVGLKWYLPALMIPGWLPSGVFLGLLFSNPMQTLRRRRPCMRCAFRFAFGVGIAAFVHLSASLLLQNDSAFIFLPFVLPLLIVPMFLKSGLHAAMETSKPSKCSRARSSPRDET